MVKIAFWDNGLGERGTSVALYDYAFFNETILGNESIIFFNYNHYSNKKEAVEKFSKRFTVFGVNCWDEMDNLLKENECDLLYIIKAGNWDGQISKVIKTCVHCVFDCSQPHGQVYSSIADWVPHNNGKYPTVPHMINLPDHNNNLRTQLGIPENAVVFGRHGGIGQFDIAYVHNIVYQVAKNNPSIYFLFMNTKPFCEPLLNIIHIPMIVNLDKKVSFINTCDAMMWARSDGEVFSLSQGEFCIKNKPIICTESGSLGHKHLLKDKAIWYNEHNLYNILTGFDREEMAKKDWNAYSEYTPEKVMQIFKKVFIDE